MQQLTRIEHPELHARIFDVVACDQFRFCLAHIEGRTAKFRDGGDEENQRGKRREENKPNILCFCDRADTHGTCENGRDEHDRQHRNFKREQYCHFAECANQSILIIGGPACHNDRERANRARSNDIQRANVQIHAEHGGGKRHHRPQDQNGHHRKQRRKVIHNFICARGSNIFFDQKFDDIGKRLDQPKRTDAVWTDAGLKTRNHFAFNPNKNNIQHH